MVEVVSGHRDPGGPDRSDKYLSPGIRWLSAGVETRGQKLIKPHHQGKWSKISNTNHVIIPTKNESIIL